MTQMARVSFKSVSPRGFTPRVRRNMVTTQFTTHTKVLAASLAAKCMQHRNLLEPTIGLEPMTCRLRNDWEAVLFLCFQEFNRAYQSVKLGCLGRSVMQELPVEGKHEFRGN